MASEENMVSIGGKAPASLKRRLTAWRKSRAIPVNESAALRYMLEMFLADVPDPGPDTETDYQAEKQAHVFAPDREG